MKVVQSSVFYCLLQFYMVYRVSFIVVSVCSKGFAYLLCWPRGRGVGLTCTWRFSFHEFYNFLPFNFLIFIIFFGNPFFYPRHLPTPTFTTHDKYPHPRPTTFRYTRLKWGETSIAVFRHHVSLHIIFSTEGFFADRTEPTHVNSSGAKCRLRKR